MKFNATKSFSRNGHGYVFASLALSAAIMIASAIFGTPYAMSNQPTSSQSAEVCKNSYSLLSYDLRPRSVPKFIRKLEGDLALTDEQKPKIKAIMQRVPVEVLPMREQIKQLEIKLLQAMIEEGKTAQQLKPQLDEVQTMKRSLAEKEIGVFNEIRAILTPEQYRQAMLDSGWRFGKEG